MPPDIVQLFNKICQKINFLTVLFQNIIVMYTKYAYRLEQTNNMD